MSAPGTVTRSPYGFDVVQLTDEEEKRLEELQAVVRIERTKLYALKKEALEAGRRARAQKKTVRSAESQWLALAEKKFPNTKGAA